jgi:hypothetical protein
MEDRFLVMMTAGDVPSGNRHGGAQWMRAQAPAA